MFEFFQAASDDQVALMGCAGVLLCSGFLMYISYFIGPAARRERMDQMEQLVRQRQELLMQAARDHSRDKAA